MDNLTTATPVEVDTRLAELERQDSSLTLHIQHAWSDLRAALGHRQERVILRNGRSEYLYLTSAHDAEHEAVAIMVANPHAAENVHAAWALLIELRKQVLVNRAERTKLKIEFNRRGGWTRAWAVPNGHVHQSTACGTCYPTTMFGWLPQVSGMNEAAIVELAGERACTVCYPSAPVDALKRATRLHTTDEAAELEAKAARAAELEAKRAAKAAKGIARPDGAPLLDDHGYVVKTEIAARNAVLSAWNYLLFYGETHPSADAWIEMIADGTEALAHKQGRDLIAVREEFKAKAEKKHARESAR